MNKNLTIYRNKLTDLEFNAIANLTSATHLDSEFDVIDCGKTDKFYDFNEEKKISLKEGLDLLYSGLAYSLYHEGLGDDEAIVIVNLFIEFDIIDKDDKDAIEILLNKEEEE